VTTALLFCVSMVSLGLFGLLYWRKRMRSVSALPVSDRVRAAAGIATTTVGALDFGAILRTHELLPDLRGSGDSFRALRAYFAVVQMLGRLIPSMAKWSEAELTSCARYAAVKVDQHLERNRTWSDQMRGK
jgi:hypothetical protein